MSDQHPPGTIDPGIAAALAQGGLIDMTTRGRRSGQPHRIEIVFFNFGGSVYISGLPGRRDWYANVLAEPRFTVHLKGTRVADLPARAIPITDEPTRRAILSRITHQWRRELQLDQFVAGSPLIRVEFLHQVQPAA